MIKKLKTIILIALLMTYCASSAFAASDQRKQLIEVIEAKRKAEQALNNAVAENAQKHSMKDLKIQELIADKDLEIQKLTATHNAALLGKETEKSQLTKEHNQELTEKSNEINSLKEAHNQAINDLNRAAEQEKQLLTEKHVTEIGNKTIEIDQLKASHRTEVQSLTDEKTRLVSEHSTALSQKSQEIIDLQAAHSTAITESSRKHAEEIAALNQDKQTLSGEKHQTEIQCEQEKTVLKTDLETVCNNDKRLIQDDLDVCKERAGLQNDLIKTLELEKNIKIASAVCNLEEAFADLAKKHAETLTDAGMPTCAEDVLLNNPLFREYLTTSAEVEILTINATAIDTSFDFDAFVRIKVGMMIK